MTEPVAVRNGDIDKFIGDAVMSHYGPPFTDVDRHAADACLAALEQRDRLTELRRLHPNIPHIDLRVGISTGDIVVGSIGSEVLRSYTVIGDQVNVASRLEALGKRYGTHILISGRTHELAGDTVETREIDRVAVRGRTQETSIYEVIAPTGGLSETQTQLIAEYRKGLARLLAGHPTAAEQAFRRCLELAPGDGPAEHMLDRCAAESGC